MPRTKKSDSAGDLEKIKSVEYAKLQEKIIENLIELQKVHTNLAEKFDNLTNQITGLLTLFESAARSFADHPANIGTEKDKEFLDKIDKLLEQNKTIAKGLTLMEERVRERVYGAPTQTHVPEENDGFQYTAVNRQTENQANRPLPKF